jgi:hypothetical protein
MCLRGTVAIETDMPVFWAWYDHSQASRRAHGAAYATYVGGWKSKVRGVGRQDVLARFDDLKRRQVRSFCSLCGTPMMFTRGGLPERVNIPRALLGARTGRKGKVSCRDRAASGRGVSGRAGRSAEGLSRCQHREGTQCETCTQRIFRP